MAKILESAVVDIPLSGGLAEKVDPRLLPAGSYAVLENLVQDKAGAFRKRYGFGAESAAAGTGGSVAVPCQLGDFRGQPWTLSDEEGDSPLFYQRDGGAWEVKTRVEFGRTIFRREVVRPPGKSFFERIHRAPSIPRQRVVALWVESDSSLTVPPVASRLFYRVLDSETGLDVVPRTQIVASAQHPFASCLVGTKVIFVQLNAVNAYVVRSLDLQTLALTTLATIVPAGSVSAGAVDVCRYDAANFLLAYRDGNAVVTQIRSAATGALGATVTSGVLVGVIVIGLAFLAAPGAVWCIVQRNLPATPPDGINLNSTGPTNLTGGVTTALTMATIAAPATRIAPVAFDLPGTGPTCLAAITGPTNATPPAIVTELQVIDSGYGNFVTELVPWAEVQTKPIESRGRLWMVFSAHAQVAQTAAGNVDVSTNALVALLATETDVAVRIAAVTGRLRSEASAGVLGPTPQLGGNIAGLAREFDICSRVFVDVGKNERFGADWTRVSMNPYALGSNQGAPCVGALALSGSYTAWYDGADVYEHGYLNDPQIVSTTQTAGVGAIAIGVYDFWAVYEYTDDAGNLQRSAPSAPVRVNVAVANTRVAVAVAVTGLTYRVASRILVHVFRTLAGPGPDAYRLTSTASAPRNNPNATSAVVTFNADASDAQVQALGLGFLYASSQIPARTPPPSNAVLVHKGRGWLANADGRGSVFVSKPFPLGGGLAPEFADELEILLPEADGPVLALAASDEDVAAFTERKVFLISGDGPLANGQGAPFSVVSLPSEHGCINAASVASTDRGSFFQSERGICLLGRDRTVSYAGPAVEDLMKTYAAVRSVLVDQGRRRVLWLCRSVQAAVAQSTIVCLDLDTGVWSNWLVPTAIVTGQAMCGTDHWISTLDREFGREAGNNCRDFGTDYVQSAIETPWIHPGGLTEHIRTRRWGLQAERRDLCMLTADVYCDFNPASTQTFLIDLGTSTRTLDVDHLRLSMQIAQQKHSALKLRFVDSQYPGDTTSFGRGLDYGGLSLDLAGKRGLAKVAAGNRS
jgi:hypothetical protein